jgi:hypothetical protein
MNMRLTNYVIGLLSGLLVFTACRQPEPEEPDPVRRKSPIAIAKITHEPSNTYVKVVYGQPYKRDREIFGDLVPYGEVWRTGANEATELTTTNDIIFAGQELTAGTYTLFSIPREGPQWTVILNNELGQWGSFDYSDSSDVLRADVPAMDKQATTEAFTVQFGELEQDSTNIVMQWDQKVVKIPVEFVSSSNTNSP